MKPALIPQPHRLREGKGYFVIPASGEIAVSDSSLLAVSDEALGVFRRHTVARNVTGARDSLVIALSDGLKPGGYRLSITRVGCDPRSCLGICSAPWPADASPDRSAGSDR